MMSCRKLWLMLTALFVLSACDNTELPPRAVGQLESERIELTAVTTEKLMSRPIAEGSRVAVGDIVFQLDSSLALARLEEAEARVVETKSALGELLEGTRIEQLQAVRAQVAGARKETEFRDSELKRFRSLKDRGLAAAEQLDMAQIAKDTATASLDAAKARLRELIKGPRQQTIEQSAARLQLAQATLKAEQILVERYQTQAPVDGVLDRYLFEVGERPNAGQVVAVLLAADQPYARVYIPADIRTQVHAGDKVTVNVDGYGQALQGRVRWISSEAAFTPFFALTDYDRHRLSYLAKIDLPATVQRLPDGVPLVIEFAPGTE